MAKKFREKLRKLNPFTRPATLEELPKPLPANPDQRLVRVYVEGYEDVAFWRGIFDHFQNPYMRFEISVPNRADLPKGKKVLMGMIPRSSDELILCVDSDFDFLSADRTEQSRLRHRELPLLRPFAAQRLRQGHQERYPHLRFRAFHA